MIVPLETKRLFLRPLQLADATDAGELFRQWEIVKFLNAAVPWRQYREVILPAIERGEEWHWSPA